MSTKKAKPYAQTHSNEGMNTLHDPQVAYLRIIKVDRDATAAIARKYKIGRYSIALLSAYFKHGQPSTVLKMDNHVRTRKFKSDSTYVSLYDLVQRGFLYKAFEKLRRSLGGNSSYYACTALGKQVAEEYLTMLGAIGEEFELKPRKPTKC